MRCRNCRKTDYELITVRALMLSDMVCRECGDSLNARLKGKR